MYNLQSKILWYTDVEEDFTQQFSSLSVLYTHLSLGVLLLSENFIT